MPSSMTESQGSPLRFYEAWASETQEITTRSGIVPYQKLDDWLTLKAEYAIMSSGDKEVSDKDVLLRLISCDFTRHPFSLGCDNATFERLREAFDLHRTTKEALMNNNGTFVRCFSRTPGSIEIGNLAMVAKVPNSVNIGFDGLSLSFDRKAQTTRAFLHGLPDDAHQLLLQNLRKQNDISAYRHPLLLLSHVIRRHQRQTEAHRLEIDKSISQLKREIGYDAEGMLDDTPLKVLRDLDFDNILRRLHPCQTQIAIVTHASNFGLEFGKFLHRTEQELGELDFMSEDDATLSTRDQVIHRIEFATNLYAMILSQISVLSQRVQSHINLTFSLIAQEENRLNRSIAEKSTMIALASKRDSAVMKTIALLTTVFLPPTFVATFFSMTMFDWSPDIPNTQVASKYLWVYWTCAIPLTALVLVTWRIWWTVEEKRYQAELLQAKNDLRMTVDYAQQDEAISKARARLGLRDWATPGRTRYGSFELGRDWD